MLSCEGCAWKKKAWQKVIGGKAPCVVCIRSSLGISCKTDVMELGKSTFKTPLDLYISEDMVKLIKASINREEIHQ